jgi:hypothetical protein
VTRTLPGEISDENEPHADMMRWLSPQKMKGEPSNWRALISNDADLRIARHPPATAKIWTPDFPGALAERLGEWLLKNSFSAQTASNPVIENVYPVRENHL